MKIGTICRIDLTRKNTFNFFYILKLERDKLYCFRLPLNGLMVYFFYIRSPVSERILYAAFTEGELIDKILSFDIFTIEVEKVVFIDRGVTEREFLDNYIGKYVPGASKIINHHRKI